MKNKLSSNQVKLPYGLKDGELVHISQVPSGLACHCYCASCDTPLVAKKGKKNAHGFSHYKSDECAHAFETTLHYLAKKVLEESAEISLPEFIIHEQVSGEICGRSITKSGSATVCIEHSVMIEDIKLEKPLGQIIPDVIATINGSRFLIEIAVTHFVDELKEQKLNKIQIPCIEIDLSDVARDANIDEIRKQVVDLVVNKTWLFHAETEIVRERLKADLKSKLKVELDAIYKEEQERKRKENELRQQKIAAKNALLEKLKPSIKSLESYMKEKDKRLDQYSISLPNHSIWQRAVSTMGISIKSIPEFLNQPIKGENIFACDRRVWQSALFTVFIYGKLSKYEQPYPISVHTMIEWCKSYVPLNRFAFTLWGNKKHLDSKVVNVLSDFDLYTAVREFTRHLEKEDYLKFHYQDFYKIEKDYLFGNSIDFDQNKCLVTGISISQYNSLFEDQKEAFEERAGILEFCCHFTRKNAEKKAYEIVLSK